jgi:hypothetical protein
MGSFGIWHLIIVLLLVGIGVWAWWLSQKPPRDGGQGLVGFRGWLLILVIAQSLAPLGTLADWHGGLVCYLGFPKAALAASVQMALALCVFLVQVVVAIVMHERKRSFPRFFLYQWFVVTGLALVNLLAIWALLPFTILQLIESGSVGHPIAAFIATGLWVLYVFNSERVRNTFVD